MKILLIALLSVLHQPFFSGLSSLQNGISFSANQSAYHAKTNQIHFDLFAGKVPFNQKGKNSYLHIQSPKALFDKTHQLLLLTEHVKGSLEEHHFSMDRAQLSMIESHAFSLVGFGHVSFVFQQGDTFTGDELSWKSEEKCMNLYGAPVLFSSNLCKAHGKKAHITYDIQKGRYEVAHFSLEGDISLLLQGKGKNSFGLADSISYDPESKEFSLEGEKVLFCNEDDTIRMKAKKIIIDKDHQVKGVGRVHFSFSQEEEETFNKQFSKFLHLR
jgi:lipopolysaccharide export system protein LptA